MKKIGELIIKVTLKHGCDTVDDVYENIKDYLTEYGCGCKCLDKTDLRPKGNCDADEDIECDECGNTVATSFDLIKTEKIGGVPFEHFKCLVCGYEFKSWDSFYSEQVDEMIKNGEIEPNYL